MTTKTCLSKFGLAVCMVIFIADRMPQRLPPIEFYTLTPLAGIAEADKAAGLGDAVAVGVGPLQMPKIIDRPQIVSRTGVNKINVDEFHRWAGSLYEDFLRVLTLNLSVAVAMQHGGGLSVGRIFRSGLSNLYGSASI